MPSAPLPPNEPDRLQALYDCEVLDTAPEREFDDLTRLACRLTGAPVAVISLVDTHRQWFKSTCNFHAKETPRSTSFCSYAILQQEPLIIMDATRDSRVSDNPLVTGEPGIRAYAGVPLLTIDGLALGTLCVIDFRIRGFSALDIEDLQCLARQAVAHLELRREVNALAKARAASEAAAEALRRAA
jgi:GAF domain-containing protein